MAISTAQETNPQLAEFRNESLIDFSSEQNRRAMEQALAQVRGELGKEYDLIIGGQRLRTDRKLKSYNPSKPSEVVGVFQKATEPLVQQAVAEAEKAFGAWSQRSTEERVSMLLRLSQIMQERRLELAAWMVFEVGKSWAEADADVAEAIDFCEFYAREALRLAGPQEVTRIDGEDNHLFYIPLGVGVVIPPWNFPLAILTGMTTAAVVTGNTAIVKPSSDLPTIAAKLVEMTEQVGFPAGCRQFPDRQRGGGRRHARDAPATSGSLLSPARKKSGCGSMNWPRRCRRARFGSSAPSWRWAERTRSLSTARAIWMKQQPGSWLRPSASRARNARPAPGRLCSNLSTMIFFRS